MDLAFVFEVTAKVESLHLDGQTKFMLHGKLSVNNGDGEPMNLAISVPQPLWEGCKLGEVLTFPLAS